MPKKWQLMCDMCDGDSCGNSLWRGVPVELSCADTVHIAYCDRRVYAAVTEV